MRCAKEATAKQHNWKAATLLDLCVSSLHRVLFQRLLVPSRLVWCWCLLNALNYLVSGAWLLQQASWSQNQTPHQESTTQRESIHSPHTHVKSKDCTTWTKSSRQNNREVEVKFKTPRPSSENMQPAHNVLWFSDVEVSHVGVPSFFELHYLDHHHTSVQVSVFISPCSDEHLTLPQMNRLRSCSTAADHPANFVLLWLHWPARLQWWMLQLVALQSQLLS